MGLGFQQNGLGNVIDLYPFNSRAQEKAENDEIFFRNTNISQNVHCSGDKHVDHVCVSCMYMYKCIIYIYYLYNIINILQQEILYLCFNVRTQSCPIACSEQHAYVSSKRKISIGVDNSRTRSGIIAFGDVISWVARK